jgi:hypothetical protein
VGYSATVDVSEFYERVEKLISDLGASGHKIERDELEVAIRPSSWSGRGAGTSEEVLGRLSAALSAVATSLAPWWAREAEDLAACASEQLGS